jgi:hypothetical protein
MSSTKIIAVDFDGCLAENEYPNIGAPILRTIEKLRAEQEAGARVILWTCRRDNEVKAAVRWCEDRGIRIDAVNENLPEMIEFFGEDTRKVFANEYWDDRAVVMKAEPKIPLIPIEQVLEDMYSDLGPISSAATDYYKTHYATREEAAKMDREEKRRFVLSVAILVAPFLALAIYCIARSV